MPRGTSELTPPASRHVRVRAARFNRRVGNRIAAPMLARRGGFGTIEHRGRRSGKVYRTPVKVFRLGEEYVITLPYGSGCDWVRNVVADAGCRLVTGRGSIDLVAPRVFVGTDAIAMPRTVRWVLRRMDVDECLALTPATVQTPVRGF